MALEIEGVGCLVGVRPTHGDLAGSICFVPGVQLQGNRLVRIGKRSANVDETDPLGVAQKDQPMVDEEGWPEF
jgi:hypothetical protein